MSEFIITTDNTSDLPDSYISENDLDILFLSYTIDGETYERENQLSAAEFYKRMRNGSMPTTAQINPDMAKEKFTKYLKEGKDILHISFSSGLSGSYNSCRIAAEELQEDFPDRRIVVVDSLCASLGEGLLVHKAVCQKKEGKSLAEITEWLEENKLHLCHNFTVDDLNHLYRGGRVSKAAAVFGTMVNIKPVLHVDDEGHLVPVSKVRGRKKSLTTLVDNMEKQVGKFENDTIFISHGDCLTDAEFVARLVRERFGIQSFLINTVGPTIGAHSGPGTVALFFMGNSR
ncbi:DegV family protein [Diplocloster agilis]|uniref:DegV family protein n=1 Tax=Diplocloster agilis TaxID=2850323 RepID=A0A949NC20_9FIRM|nr:MULTISPECIES: DegV family protein [Lachnospiraceae]MBU9738182.1 DegV family protein [Diplocloster agilis]MBU9743713.1 DegV family protein [Diplocloster agilis]MCU6736086.1 DegV family protein [Suonthocola fibrivorans]SCJ85997.1 DegV domain-containing protein SAV1425 [uncultured Clostridium sp.]